MLSPIKIFEKRLKRKRTLERRLRCHGTKSACSSHIGIRRTRPPAFSLRPEMKRVGLWRRIINWIKHFFV